MREKQTKSRVGVEISPTLDSKKDRDLDAPSSTRSKKSLEPSGKLGRPTPLDFDAFVPWVCLEWQSPVNVIVTRVTIEEYLRPDFKKGSSPCIKSSKSLKVKEEKSLTRNVEPSKVLDPNEQIVPVTAHYDNRGQLIEISIVNCKEIHRKVIQAISICISFHSLLTKLTIRKGGVTALLLNEISKLLPHSNLTDICLDDCFVPEGNYDVILMTSLPLKSLSLNRCGINDTMCENIATKIDFGASGSSLLILELGSNLITDNGAKAIGGSLRKNRSLLHLNLSGNMISDDGAYSILMHLKEFPLTRREILDCKKIKNEYTQNKEAVYKRFYEELFKQQRAEMATASNMTKSFKGKKIKKSKHVSSFQLETKSIEDIAETMTQDMVGKFSHPFDDDNVEKRECHYSKGNLVLCSLNLAFNNLSFMSIKMLRDVLNYQENALKHPGTTGLIRVVFIGNYIPASCAEYEQIEMNLMKVVKENVNSRSQRLTVSYSEK